MQFERHEKQRNKNCKQGMRQILRLDQNSATDNNVLWCADRAQSIHAGVIAFKAL